MSLMKMPIAPPIPPTHGPNKTAKTAGITTAGKNATPRNVTPAVKISNRSVKRCTYANDCNVKCSKFGHEFCSIFQVINLLKQRLYR